MNHVCLQILPLPDPDPQISFVEVLTDSNHHLKGQFLFPKLPFPLPRTQLVLTAISFRRGTHQILGIRENRAKPMFLYLAG